MKFTCPPHLPGNQFPPEEKSHQTHPEYAALRIENSFLDKMCPLVKVDQEDDDDDDGGVNNVR